MRCPECGVEAVAADVPACARCGFTVDRLDAEFGSDPVAMDQITDMGTHLSARELRRLGQAAAAFGKRFAPFYFCVFVGDPPGPGSGARFGLWLMNRGRMDTPQGPMPGTAECFLLVLDPGRGELSLHLGYLAEALVKPGAADRVLAAGSAALRRGRHGAGLQRCVAELACVLREASEQANGTG